MNESRYRRSGLACGNLATHCVIAANGHLTVVDAAKKKKYLCIEVEVPFSAYGSPSGFGGSVRPVTRRRFFFDAEVFFFFTASTTVKWPFAAITQWVARFPQSTSTISRLIHHSAPGTPHCAPFHARMKRGELGGQFLVSHQLRDVPTSMPFMQSTPQSQRGMMCKSYAILRLKTPWTLLDWGPKYLPARLRLVPCSLCCLSPWV